MQNKRNFNNLFDSICVTILFFVCAAFYIVALWFGVINANEGTNQVALLICSTVFFGGIISLTITLIIKDCYEYWFLSNDSIISKKLFSKRKVIKLAEVEKVEKKIVSALVLGTYKSEAYVIYSNIHKIVILIDKRKKYPELDYKLAKFINN